MELRLRYQTDREICATWGPVVIRICDGIRSEVEDLVRMEQLFDELLTTHKSVAMLLVLTHGTPLPDHHTHRHARDSMLRYGDRLLVGVAIVGLGFWASAMNTTLGLLVRVVGRGNMFLESSAERVIDRLAADLIGLDADGLLAAYRELWDQLVSSARRAG